MLKLEELSVNDSDLEDGVGESTSWEHHEFEVFSTLNEGNVGN